MSSAEVRKNWRSLNRYLAGVSPEGQQIIAEHFPHLGPKDRPKAMLLWGGSASEVREFYAEFLARIFGLDFPETAVMTKQL